MDKEYHRHKDGSHWCDHCRGYCGSSGDYGCDMAEDHPINCACRPCPFNEGVDCGMPPIVEQ